MSRPDAGTDLDVGGMLRRIALTWTPLPWSAMVDDYRTHGVTGTGDVDPTGDFDLRTGRRRQSRTVHPR